MADPLYVYVGIPADNGVCGNLQESQLVVKVIADLVDDDCVLVSLVGDNAQNNDFRLLKYGILKTGNAAQYVVVSAVGDAAQQSTMRIAPIEVIGWQPYEFYCECYSETYSINIDSGNNIIITKKDAPVVNIFTHDYNSAQSLNLNGQRYVANTIRTITDYKGEYVLNKYTTSYLDVSDFIYKNGILYFFYIDTTPDADYSFLILTPQFLEGVLSFQEKSAVGCVGGTDIDTISVYKYVSMINNLTINGVTICNSALNNGSTKQFDLNFNTNIVSNLAYDDFTAISFLSDGVTEQVSTAFIVHPISSYSDSESILLSSEGCEDGGEGWYYQEFTTKESAVTYKGVKYTALDLYGLAQLGIFHSSIATVESFSFSSCLLATHYYGWIGLGGCDWRASPDYIGGGGYVEGEYTDVVTKTDIREVAITKRGKNTFYITDNTNTGDFYESEEGDSSDGWFPSGYSGPTSISASFVNIIGAVFTTVGDITTSNNTEVETVNKTIIIDPLNDVKFTINGDVHVKALDNRAVQRGSDNNGIMHVFVDTLGNRKIYYNYIDITTKLTAAMVDVGIVVNDCSNFGLL